MIRCGLCLPDVLVNRVRVDSNLGDALLLLQTLCDPHANLLGLDKVTGLRFLRFRLVLLAIETLELQGDVVNDIRKCFVVLVALDEVITSKEGGVLC